MATIVITGSITPPSSALAANTILDFQGGKYVGGTLTGNGTIIKAPPYLIFDGVTLAGTWKIDYVYPEYFGNTDGTNAAPAINEALKFSNITGCKVMLLAKEYKITQSIIMRGGTTLEGQIPASGLPSNSLSSIYGTKISMNSGTSPAIDIKTISNSALNSIDCYRFAIRNLCVYNAVSGGDSISISTSSGTTTPREGVVENILIQHSSTSGGYAIKIAGGSYLRFERISIYKGKGILFDNSSAPYQEFIWMRQIAINEVTDKSIEVRRGNNLYITETDVNDSAYGLYFYAKVATQGIFAISVQSTAIVRCNRAIYINSQNGSMTRFVMRDLSIFLNNGAIGVNSTRSGIYALGDSIFDNIMVDRTGVGTGITMSIKEENASMYNCRFTNVRAPDSSYTLDTPRNKYSATYV